MQDPDHFSAEVHLSTINGLSLLTPLQKRGTFLHVNFKSS